MALQNPIYLGPVGTDQTGPPASAQTFRGLVAALLGEGVVDVPSGDLAVSATTGMVLSVASGAAVVAGDDVPRQGSFYVPNVGATNVTAQAPPASNSRIDVLLLRVYDGQSAGGTTNRPVFEWLTGTSAASPAAPTAIPNNAIPLAQVTITAGTTTVTAGMLTDRRLQAGAGATVGTAAQPLTTAQIAALTTAQRFPGRLIENTTTGKLQHVVTAGTAPVDVAPLLAAAGTIIDTTTTLAANASITKRIAVPAGAARGVLGLKSTGSIGGQAFFTTSAAAAFGTSNNSSGVVALRHRSIPDTEVIPSAVAPLVHLVDVYIDTVTSELVLVFTNTNTISRTFTMYATYEVF